MQSSKIRRQILVKAALLVAAAAGAGAARADSATEFFRAVARDDDTTVGALLQRGFPASARDEKGVPALILAVRGPAPKVLQRLLAAPDVDLEAANVAGETALMLAALAGNADATRRIADRGARFSSPSGWSALHYAASGPDAETVAILLTRGAPVDARAPNGNTPLMMAARYGTEAAIDMLLARQADLRLLNANGSSAVEMARAAGRDALANRLAELYARGR